MSDDEGEPKRYPAPEVLPPISRSVSLAPEVSDLPQGLLGMSLFARARYASEQKQFEAYRQLVAAKNALVRVLTEQRSVTEAYVIASERMRHLDDIRAVARLEVKARLDGIKAQGELSQLQFETEKERLMYERDRYRKMREGLNAPPPEAGGKTTFANQFNDVCSEIEELERAFEDYKAEVIARAGGEGNLSEDELRRLGQFEMVRDSALNDVLGKLLDAPASR